jgi:hypothetical protein
MFKELLDALDMAFAMGWEILWPLVLGFALSAVIQAIVSHREMSRLLPDDSPRSIGIALGLTAAAVPTSWAIAGTAESAVLASSKARLPGIRGFIRDGITHLKNEPWCPL